MFLAQIHGSGNLSHSGTRGAAVIFHSSASTAATFDRGLLASQSRLLTFFPSLLLPVFSSVALCVQIVCVGYPFSYSFACVSYPAISTTHSHTYIQTLYICTVTHKHNHRQRCNLLCNFFFFFTLRALLSSETNFSPFTKGQKIAMKTCLLRTERKTSLRKITA